MSVSFKKGHKIAECIAREYIQRNPKLSFDDLYQEAWIGIMGAKKQDDTLGSTETYLSSAARNACMNYVFKFRSILSGSTYRNREDVSVIKREKPEKILDVISRQKSADDSVQERQTREQIYRVLARFGYDDSKIKWVSMILLDEYRAREVAEAIGVDVTKIYQTMKDVKKRLSKTDLKDMRYKN